MAVREDNIRATQLRLIARSPVALLGALLAGAFAVAVLWSYLDRRWLLTWAAALLAITVVRLILWSRFRRIAQDDARVIRWLWPLTVTVSITGLIWGVFGISFYLVADIEIRAVILLILAGTRWPRERCSTRPACRPMAAMCWAAPCRWPSPPSGTAARHRSSSAASPSPISR
ncbi:MAG TPA: hypothetical protein VJO12_11160 [Stellaceae bacterium]|nr:hypothetical protein [Stellaceae bacterium]